MVSCSESIPYWPFDRPRWLARFFRGKEYEVEKEHLEFQEAMQAAREIFAEQLLYPKFWPEECSPQVTTHKPEEIIFMNGVKPIQNPEGGEQYELNWEGKTRVFDDKQLAQRALMLHVQKDAGRALNEEEKALLVDAQSPNEGGKAEEKSVSA